MGEISIEVNNKGIFKIKKLIEWKGKLIKFRRQENNYKLNKSSNTGKY